MNMNLVLKHLKTTALETILIPNLGRIPIIDMGRLPLFLSKGVIPSKDHNQIPWETQYTMVLPM